MHIASWTRDLRQGGKTGWEVHYEASKQADGDADVIMLSIGEHDFDTPEPIVDACIGALRDGQHHYTNAGGIAPLLAAIADREQDITGVRTTPANVIAQSGAQGALFSAALSVADPHDEIIIVEPHYVTYPATMRATGAKVVTVGCDADHDFAVSPDAIAAAVTENTSLILINTPNNPTGAVYPRDTLEAIAEICRQRDIWLMSDEVYSDFCYDADFVHPRALKGMADRTIVVSSLSKSYAMTGWRMGWAIAPEPLIEAMNDISLVMHYGLPEFIQTAAVSAFADHTIADRIVNRYRARRDLFIAALAEEGFQAHTPAGGMNVMLDLRALNRSSEDICWQLLKEEKVSVLPGDGFGPSAKGFVRISFCNHEDKLAEAAHRIGRFLRRQGLNG
ncbi:MAG: aminotransferase class I/II-fold pyridoxal phosphate-dependent enzyme [Pseudomonadota bacterium]